MRCGETFGLGKIFIFIQYTSSRASTNFLMTRLVPRTLSNLFLVGDNILGLFSSICNTIIASQTKRSTKTNTRSKIAEANIDERASLVTQNKSFSSYRYPVKIDSLLKHINYHVDNLIESRNR